MSKGFLPVGLLLLVIGVYFMVNFRKSTGNKDGIPLGSDGETETRAPSECTQESSEIYLEPYYMTASREEDIECITLLGIAPPTPICLHPLDVDIYHSKAIKDRGMAEHLPINMIRDHLQKDTELGFIDLGANIGLFSLPVASMGRRVLAVEPFSENIHRLQKAARIGNLTSNLVLLKNGISDKRGLAIISRNKVNQADTRIEKREQTVRQCPHVEDCEEVKTILIDDLLTFVASKKAILKIDIQGYEHRAFQHAGRLFDAVDIPYIFMEWGMISENYVSADHVSEDKEKVVHLIEFMVSRSYYPVSLFDIQTKLDIKDWHKWPYDVIWVHE